jgi:hypothetical protein
MPVNSDVRAHMTIRTLLPAAFAVLAGCASSYEPPSGSAHVSTVFVVGNGGYVQGGFDSISLNLLRTDCKIDKHLQPVKFREDRAVSIAAGDPIILQLGHGQIRPNVPVGRSSLLACSDALAFTPERGKEYRAVLDLPSLQAGVCAATLLERAVEEQRWRTKDVPRMCTSNR